MEEMISSTMSVEEYLYLAEDKLVEFIKNNKYKDFLKSMPNLYKYSVGNQILIYSQNPKATYLNGMNSWNYCGRKIIKGEKSIKIIQPTFKEITEEVEKDGTKTSNTNSILDGYKVSHLFDISQTEGKDLQINTLNKEKVMNNYEKITNALKQSASNYKFKFTDQMKDTDNSYCDYENKIIAIRQGLGYEETLSALIDEVANAILNNYKRENFMGIVQDDIWDVKNLEKQSVVFVIKEKLGLENETKDLDVLSKLSDEDMRKFKFNLDYIRKASYRIINQINKALAEEQEKTKTTAKEVELQWFCQAKWCQS